ncbi:MAG: DNA-deoxyinosine glycosylase [Methanococcoides sp.]|nr:DNA-deoxyinosine glycosylase [Methanococcoides sp.]
MDPIIDKNTTLLIVGTFPSQISRDANQYYGNPRNQFWKLMGKILAIDLQDSNYDGRIQFLHDYQIGLWDTLKDCEITGSSDSSIRNEEYNDFSQLTSIKKIICNGKKAEKYIKHCNVPTNVDILVVPSSSPARAMKISDKSEMWKEVIGTVEKRSCLGNI